ncbi:MAG: hypothetical protein HA489_05385 [Archaeoglobales archaeon]|jgi:hypothetical protein|nr:hypothetical protein [Archaeoglobi archaeon]NHW23667.1 hypothetical protein [Archaeoglobales archaeon]TDA27988.1 MAG: hypothetical protein DSO00_06135 [Archaeoglobi archaeon]
MLTDYASKIFASFDELSEILKKEGDNLVVEDDPLRVVIKRDRIEFYVSGEFHGFVSESEEQLSELVSEEAKLWLQALANLHFKRFSLRR